MYNVINLETCLKEAESFLGITAYHGDFNIAQLPLVPENIELSVWSDTVSCIKITKDFQVQLVTGVAERRIKAYASTLVYAYMLVNTYISSQLHISNLCVLPNEAVTPVEEPEIDIEASPSTGVFKGLYTEIEELQKRAGVIDFKGSIEPEDLRNVSFKDSLQHIGDGKIEYTIIKNFKAVMQKDLFKTFNTLCNSGQYMRMLCDIYFLKNGIIKHKDMIKFIETRIDKFLVSVNL